jgi:hypothetical protein
MRDCIIVEAAQPLSKIRKFGCLGRDWGLPLNRCLVHRRYARLNVDEVGARRGLADRYEMRFHRAFEECGK